MKKILQNKTIMPKVFILLIISSSLIFYGYSTGITGRTKKNGNGCNCHGSSASSSVNVSISGPTDVQPGSTNTYTLTITGGPLTRGGTNIAASAGSLSPVSGSGLQLLSDELTHTAPKAPISGSVSFQFKFTAPSTQGIVTLYANGNSVNFNGTTSGDAWNFSENKVINVTTSTDVNEKSIVSDFKLEQNYPNPFNPNTFINFSIPTEEFVTLKIYNLNGEEIKTLVSDKLNAGEHKYQFSADDNKLTSGVYLYKLVAGKYSDIKKMILVK